MSAELAVIGLGRMDYASVLDLQRTLAHARIDGQLSHDVLLLVEHPPVVTLGRTSNRQHLLASRAMLERRGVEVFEIERGGDITFHGVGQLVGYPIYKLTDHQPDLHRYLRQLEEAIITTVSTFGIIARRRDGLTGVWVQDRKIASIGIHVKKWVTWHGFALNVTTDLSLFEMIVPCGIDGVVMTSMQRELGHRAPRMLWSQTADQIVAAFAETFGQRPQAVTLDEVIPPPSCA